MLQLAMYIYILLSAKSTQICNPYSIQRKIESLQDTLPSLRVQLFLAKSPLPQKTQLVCLHQFTCNQFPYINELAISSCIIELVLQIMTSLSRFSTPKHYQHKVVSMYANEKLRSTQSRSMNLRCPKFVLPINPHFGTWFYCLTTISMDQNHLHSSHGTYKIEITKP